MPWPLIFPAIAVVVQRARRTPAASTSRRTRRSACYRLVGFTGFTEPTFEVIA